MPATPCPERRAKAKGRAASSARNSVSTGTSEPIESPPGRACYASYEKPGQKEPAFTTLSVGFQPPNG